jgi:hypothetical protein
MIKHLYGELETRSMSKHETGCQLVGTNERRDRGIREWCTLHRVMRLNGTLHQ